MHKSVIKPILPISMLWGFLFFLLSENSALSQIVHRFEGDRFTHYELEDWVSYAPALEVNSIDTDENYVYFATQNGGILRFDKYSNEWKFPYTISSGLRSNTVYTIVYNAKDGYLYARVPQGIDVLKFAENYWQPYPGDQLPDKRHPSFSEIAGLQQGKDFRFPPFFRPGNKFFPNFFTDREITFMLPDKIIDIENREFKLTDRMVDEWQRLWLGSNGLGPLLGDLFTFSLQAMPQSIPNISPRDVFFDKDNIWIGGISQNRGIGGIARWNTNEDRWKYYEAPFINGIAKDDVLAIDGNSKIICFATQYGVVIFNKKTHKWKTLTQLDGLEGDEVKDVLIFNNRAFVATENGFNWIDLNSLKVHGLSGTPIDNVQINQLTVYKERIFAATRLGLYGIDTKTDSVKFYPSSAAVPDFNLKAIETIVDEIWIASDYGIMYMDLASGEWHSFPALNLKPEVRDIESTEDVLWFGTETGLLKFDRKINYWRLFTTHDGLISNNVVHVDRKGNHLWLSTDKGITIFRYFREGRLD